MSKLREFFIYSCVKYLISGFACSNKFRLLNFRVSNIETFIAH